MQNSIVLSSLLSCFILIAGCSMATSPSLQSEIDTLKSQQAQLKQQVEEQQLKLEKMETALENGLKTVIINKRNIAMVYNIIKQITSVLIDDKDKKLDGLKAVYKIVDQMSDHYQKEQK